MNPLITVDGVCLDDVGKTALGTLYSRACEASRPNPRLKDPHSIRIVGSLDFAFESEFKRPDRNQILRAVAFDEIISRWLNENPDGTVVGLGEGLDTQYLRVDNGRMKWIAVDRENMIALRRRFLPDTQWHCNFVGKIEDFTWAEKVERARPVFIKASGVFKYFKRELITQIVRGCAERFPNGQMAFDVISRWFSGQTLKQGVKGKKKKQSAYPAMPFGMDRDEVEKVKTWHENIASVHIVDYFIEEELATELEKMYPGFQKRVPYILHLIFSAAPRVVSPTIRRTGRAANSRRRKKRRQ